MELIKQASNIFITKIKKSEIEKIDFALCPQPTQTLEKYYNAQSKKPAILINGGFFALSNGNTVFDYIDEKKVISSSDLEYGFGIDDKGNLVYGKDTDKNWKDFISAYPPLVVNGQKQKITFADEINYNARRTILGYNDTYIYTISVDSPGATLEKSADIAIQAGCKYAINLDGGGSTRLLYEGKAYAAASYNRPVDNIVAFYTKPAETITPIEQILYRVQLGAFSSKVNADNYCKKIKTLGTNYTGAFVKYIEPYYKVQVGAFAIKTNAENMVKDLKAKGYNAFIVTEKKNEIKEEPTVMSNSPLVAYTQLSPNHSGQRKQKVDRISPHCVVGQCTAESLGAWFAKSSTQASSNYGIDKNGRIGLYVEEKNRSWCTSSSANDNRAITIECASDSTEPYRMNDVVYESLIKLCVDICKRYNKTKLLWFNDKNYALNYQPKDDEMVITVHRWFANKSCPGDWLFSRLGDLANKVTAQLTNQITPPTPQPVQQEDEEMTQEKFNQMMNVWLEQQALKEPGAWSQEARDWAEGHKYVQGNEKGQKMYKKPLTREELVAVLYRIEQDR